LAGDIVRKLIPQTEGDPAGYVVGVLARFGNIVGRTAYYQVEDTKHFCNLFAVSVGATAKARKGTAADRMAHIFEPVDRAWSQNRTFSGISSGEGMVVKVRDLRIGEDGETLDLGALDKRMLLYESEFASALAVMKREGNTVSSIIRNAWDGKPLEFLVKNNPLKSTGAHISILADITAEELHLTLQLADKLNGFCNRFLWLHVERRGRLPHGGEPIDWTEETEKLKTAVAFTRNQKRVFMDRNARLMWERVYEDLSEGASGVVGAVTSRSEAQVIRLALLYAMLDCSEHIRTEHLKAGLALWDYAEASARHIFGGLSKEQKQILTFLSGTDGAGANRSEINIRCFQSHRKADETMADLETLIKTGQVVSGTGERTERYFLKSERSSTC
jgi:hypothetical protein